MIFDFRFTIFDLRLFRLSGEQEIRVQNNRNQDIREKEQKTEGRGRKADVEGISNIEQVISNDEGKKGENGYQVKNQDFP